LKLRCATKSYRKIPVFFCPTDKKPPTDFIERQNDCWQNNLLIIFVSNDFAIIVFIRWAFLIRWSIVF